MVTQADIIIIGSGASGLLLLDEILKDPILKSQSILLIDSGKREDKNWAFWSRFPPPYKNLVSKTWKEIGFINQKNKSYDKPTNPYQYQLICSNNFIQAFTTHIIPKHKNINLLQGWVKNCEKKGEKYELVLEDGRRFQGKYVADSRWDDTQAEGKIELKQHFYGRLIETQEDIFNESQALLMDFNFNHSKNSVGFGYILPYSPRKAFIEVTFFDQEVLSKEAYCRFWDRYFEVKFKPSTFSILEEEMGCIPMSTRKFNSQVKERYFKIGAAAGMIKNSTGYAFRRMQKDAKDLVNNRLEKRSSKNSLEKRFQIYDLILLNIMKQEPHRVAEIMDCLFRKNPTEKIFQFLDEETNLLEEIKLFSSLPIPLFLKHAFKIFIP